MEVMHKGAVVVLDEAWKERAKAILKGVNRIESALWKVGSGTNSLRLIGLNPEDVWLLMEMLEGFIDVLNAIPRKVKGVDMPGKKEWTSLKTRLTRGYWNLVSRLSFAGLENLDGKMLLCGPYKGALLVAKHGATLEYTAQFQGREIELQWVRSPYTGRWLALSALAGDWGVLAHVEEVVR